MKIIGHRGARGLAPENTLAALRKGLEHGVDELEFDVRVTKDNIPVLHHDASLKNASGLFKISRHSYAELKQHKPDLASLEEALNLIKTRAVPHIEVKRGEPAKPIVKVLKSLIGKIYKPEQLLLASKSQKTLLELHKLLPAVPKVVIEPWSGVRAHWRARQVDTKYVSINQRWLWWGFIIGFKNSQWRLYAYTLNDPAKAERWAGYGLYGVITDYPDRFQK